MGVDTTNLKFDNKGMLYSSSESREFYVLPISNVVYQNKSVMQTKTVNLAAIATAYRNIGLPKLDFNYLVTYFTQQKLI
jgi:hypothetical protein